MSSDTTELAYSFEMVTHNPDMLLQYGDRNYYECIGKICSDKQESGKKKLTAE